MKYLKFFFSKLIKFIRGILPLLPSILFWTLVIFINFFEEFDFSYLNPNDYCNLTDVNYTAVLHDDPDGKANVEITEYITFDVHAASRFNTYKELWRELPEDYVDGVKVTYDVKSVTQILSNGDEIPYTETPKMYWEDYDYTRDATYYWHHSKGSGTYPDNDESLLIYIPWTYREKMTFKIVYSMNNAALKYRDCSELYLSMYSGNTITKLKSYKAQILIPNEIMPSTYYAYTFGTAKGKIPYTESDSINSGYHTFTLELDEHDLKFNYHNRYIEFCLLSYGEDKHIFTQYAPQNMYSNDDALNECIAENEYYEKQNARFNICKMLLLMTSIAVSIVIIKGTENTYKKIKRKYNFYEPEVNYEYFREIPSDLDPIFASELVFMKDPFNENREKQEEYAAVLLNLVRKQYIRLVKINTSKDWSDKNTIICLEPIQTIQISPESTEIAELTEFAKIAEVSAEPVYKVTNQNTGDTLEELSTSERLYYELLKRHTGISKEITLSDFQMRINNDYGYTKKFVKDIEKKPILENGIIGGYFQDINYDAPKKELNKIARINLVWGLILLFLVNGISYYTPMALGFGAYTILGVACLWKYIYLSEKASNAVLFTQYGANEQAKWFGLYNFLNSNTLINEKEVHELPLWEKYLIYATAFGISEKVIKAIKIHAVELDMDRSLVLNRNSYIHSHGFHRTSRSFGSSIHTSSRGGGFGGHGYGGGGRGGGGGGGGH